MMIEDPYSGGYLTPHHILSAILYASWSSDSLDYKQAYAEYRELTAPDYWNKLSQDDIKIRLCQQKAEKIFNL